MEKLKIFISWSAQRSLAVAEALRDWLPNVFQMVDPWLSAADMEKGVKWRQLITGELERTDFGLICLTPENLTSPWLLFEAGALAKKAESRICTYLFDVKYEDVKDPFSQFQHTVATEVDTKKLIGTINIAMPAGASLPVERLEKAFEMWWPQLRDRLAGIPKPSAPVDSERTDSDKISEILTRVRALESVLVTREISAASEAVATLHADISAKLNRLTELHAKRDTLYRALTEISARVDVLQNTGGSFSEIADLRHTLKAIEAELVAVEGSISSSLR
jgi:hypothetical protein